MRAAIYTRISSDEAGDRLGVVRQEEDCRRLCQQRGWEVVQAYEDDDRSAFNGRPRPAYLAMLERLELGEFRVIVAWHPDRVTRSTRELEDLVDVLERTHASVVTVQGGEYDLATASGRMTARVVGAVARHDSEHNSERLRRKMEELVNSGRILGGGFRPYGYERDRLTVREDEAVIIRELAHRFLAGEALVQLVRELNEREVPTVSGKPWRLSTLTGMLTGGRIAGLREHRGEVVDAPCPWPAIITKKQHDRIRALLATKSAPRTGRRSYLLSGGLLLCGACGAKLCGNPVKGQPNYGCVSHGKGCGRVWVRASFVEELVTAAVMDAVDDPAFAEFVRARGTRGDNRAALLDITKRLDELAEDYGNGSITRRERDVARARLMKRRAALELDTAASAQTAALERWLEHPLVAEWSSLRLDVRRSIIAAVLEPVVVLPLARAIGPRFDPDRVQVRRRF
jgi:DNA invertase Pin-like site-specific DNA recombinase